MPRTVDTSQADAAKAAAKAATKAAAVAAIAAALASGCGDFREPYNLDFARILAVRTSPPSIDAGGRARVDLLAAGDDGVPFEADPATLDISEEAVALAGLPLPPEVAMLLSCADASAPEPGCYAQAPDRATLDAVRAALGLPADGVLTIPLQVTFPLPSGTAAVAEKGLFIGRAGDNPTIADVTVDGVPLPDLAADPLPLARGKHTLAVTADAGDATPSVFWYVGQGKIEQYRETTATLTFEKESGELYLGVVVRHDRGGATWRFGRVAVQ